MAADLADALLDALNDPGLLPTSGPQLVREVGGRDAAARLFSELSGPPRPADYGGRESAEFRAASTRWRSARQRALRYDERGPGKPTRGRSKLDLTAAERDRLSVVLRDRRWARMYRWGARVRLTAEVRIATPRPGRQAYRKVRTMPVPTTPGVLISSADLDPILTAAAAGDWGGAADLLLAAFAEGYEVTAIDSIDEVTMLRIWPADQREPV